MSSSFSDPVSSQNDSETNFIPGYMMEVEDDAVGSTEASNQNEDEELWAAKPYEGEPVADASWISNYYEQRRLEEDKLENLRSRLHGHVTNENWCECGNCRIERLQNEKECQCCMEIDGCIEALNSDLVKQEVTTVPQCITLHPGFSSVCLAIWSLRLAGKKYRRIDKKKYEVHGDENSYLRSVAYREYIQLVYGQIGKRRIPLPACAYHAIRTRFEGKEFKGYEDEEEST